VNVDRRAPDPAGVRPRDAVLGMAPYSPPEDLALVAARARIAPDAVIKLDANENPYGPSPRVAAALADYTRYHRYPDPDQKALRAALASYVGVPPELLIAGNGSDEIIDLLCRIYLDPDDEVIDCTPTFGMYLFSTELCGGRVLEVPRTHAWHVDADAIAESVTPRTKLIFVATPNNPSGTCVDVQAVRTLAATGRIVVLDEAYVEFAALSGGQSLARLVHEYENLVVLRTFSKWAGLAGLRIGYGVVPLPIAEQLWKTKPPFNVNLAAEAAVYATLEDLSAVQQRVRLIVEERERMAAALTAVPGIHVWPSQANFLLIAVPGETAEGLRAHLAARGIAVRAYGHQRLRNAVRISVGLPEHTDAVVAGVREWSVDAPLDARQSRSA
jgi:histidinol-phosphate aminotransferase